MIRRLFLASVLAVIGLVPVAPTSDAHAGESFCEGTFTPTAFGNVRPDGTRLGYGEGRCSSTFQGLPAGVIGTYDAGDSAAPAEIHVEVWGATATGQRIKLAECESAGVGTAQCELEANPVGPAFTLPEAPPATVVRIDCLGHSHANIKTGTTPVARFGCYSTDEAEAALREDMGL